MRVDRQPIVGMAVNSVKGLSALGGRVDVHCHAGYVRDLMENSVADLFRHPMPLCDTQVRVDRDVELHGETMADPPSAHLGHIGHTRHVLRRVLGGVQDLRVHPVEHPGEHSVSRLRSEEHTSELQSLAYLVCRLLLEKKNHGTAEPPYPSRCH